MRLARSVGTHAERRGVRVALLNNDVLARDAELVVDDLRPGRLVAVALCLRARALDRLVNRDGTVVRMRATPSGPRPAKNTGTAAPSDNIVCHLAAIEGTDAGDGTTGSNSLPTSSAK